MINNNKKKIIVCYFGTYTPEYSRNRILISGLKKNGVEVIECQTVCTGFFKYIDLAIKHWKVRNSYDVLIVGFQGIQAVILAKLITRKTIIFDAFASIYDSMILDRQNFKPKSFVAKYFWWLDKISMSLADVILFDTNENIDFAVKEFRIKKNKFKRIFVGASTDIFYPVEKKERDKNFKVLFYGSFLPLHGIEYIVRAAKLLEKEADVVFEIVGWGQEREKIVTLFNSLGTNNVFFAGGVDRELLRGKIVEADVCLGIFGNTDKAKRVIPNKVYECLAVGKPIITADTPAIRELFEDGDLIFASSADHTSLAKAIMSLKNNIELAKSVAQKGHQKFLNFATPNILGHKLLEIISEKL